MGHTADACVFCCSSVCSDSPVQCCLIAKPQGNTVKKLTAHRKTSLQEIPSESSWCSCSGFIYLRSHFFNKLLGFYFFALMLMFWATLPTHSRTLCVSVPHWRHTSVLWILCCWWWWPAWLWPGPPYWCCPSSLCSSCDQSCTTRMRKHVNIDIFMGNIQLWERHTMKKSRKHDPLNVTVASINAIKEHHNKN